MSFAARQAQSSSPELEILFDRRPLPYLKAISLESWHGVNQIPSAKIVLSGIASRQQHIDHLAKDAQHCKPGTKATIKIKSDGTLLFAGVVVDQRLELQDGRWKLTLKLKHPLQSLTASYRNQVFEKQSDADIVRSLTRAHGIVIDKLEGMPIKHAQMVQFACSDWQFLKARLGANGVWLMPMPNNVAIVVPTLGRTRHALDAADSVNNKMSLEAAELQLSSQSQPAKVGVSSWNIKQQEMSQTVNGRALKLGMGGLDPSRLKALSQMPWELARSRSLPANEEQALAKARLLGQQTAGVQARFTVDGSTAYGLGDTLVLGGFGEHFNGAGIITEVSHKIIKGQWRTTVALGLPSAEMDAAEVPQTDGLLIGAVSSYEADPDGLNRLRVKIPVLSDKPLWARFAAPYASKDSGLCFYPEEGDEVVLGFFDADPRYPVILGAMHNPKNKAPFAPSKDNAEKGMVFARGEDKQTLTFNAKEASVLLDNGKEKITIKEGIQLDGGEQFTSNAKNVSLKAEQAMQLETQQDLKLDSKKGINAEAPTIEVKASTQLGLQGTAGVKIKGATVDLSN